MGVALSFQPNTTNYPIKPISVPYTNTGSGTTMTFSTLKTLIPRGSPTQTRPLQPTLLL